MFQFKLIYFRGCPNYIRFRNYLKGTGLSFQNICQDDLPADHPLKAYSSPTVLNGDKILFGANMGTQGGGCSLEVPTQEEFLEKLNQIGANVRPSKTSSWATQMGSIGSALTVGLCPVCIPAIGGMLSALGLGFVVSEKILHPLLIAFLGITIAGLFWSYLKEHRQLAPLILGIAMGGGLYAGRYIYFGYRINQIMMYGSIVGLIVVSIWNVRLRRKVNCQSCDSPSSRSGKGS